MLTQIEQALLRCNGDIFADLCRQYLSYRYNTVFSSGFVKGKEKSKKGTPDNFIPFKDYFIFNEVTTQEQKLQEKLKKDIKHCFAQKDIPKERIVKIILICNSEISPLLAKELVDYKNSLYSNTELELVPIDVFANHIHRDYPSIARRLGIPIDTGQILEVEDFIGQYEKSQFSTTLSNKFFNRKEEINEGLGFLNQSNILMITGKAGTGKTKLALKLIEKFKDNNPEYDLKFITNNGSLDIWEDLRTQLTSNKKYLIVLDDANKLKTNLEQIVTFINTRNDKGRIKLILTVRNYIKSEVDKYVENFEFIDLQQFNESELAKILQSPEFNITNYYVNRIFSISKGNPRIAIMAAIAGINNDIKKLNNASEIYELYFSSVQKNIESFDNPDLLKTAGILSLFRVIDFEHVNTVEEIQKYFGLSKESLIESLRVLYKLEIADEYREAYKIADQILGEYIFYLVFIKGKDISFLDLLNVYIEKRHFPLTRILNPIVSNYGFESVKGFIISDLKKAWLDIKEPDTAIRFIEDFWYYIPTETLSYFNNFERITDNRILNSYLFEIYDENRINSFDDKLIKVLLQFSQFPSEFSTALQILNDYCLTSQVLFSKLLKAFKESLTYSQYSFEEKYKIQRNAFDFLYSKVKENEEFYSKVIIFIAPYYLVDNYQSNSWQGNQITIDRKWVCLIEEQKQFRTKLWQFLIERYKGNQFKGLIQNTIIKYINNLSYHYKNEDVIVFDRDIIFDFIEDNFNPNDFLENTIIEKYTSQLGLFNINYKKEINKNHQSEIFNTYLTFHEDKLKRKDFNGDWKKYEKYKEDEITQFVKNYDIKNYLKLIKDLELIYSYDDKVFQGHFGLNLGIEAILNYLRNNQFSLFYLVLENIFKSSFSNQIMLGRILSKVEYNKEKIRLLRELLKDNYSRISLLWNGIPSEEMITEDYILFREAIKNKELKYFGSISFYLPKMKSLMANESKDINEIIDVLFNRVKEDKIRLGNDFFLFIQNKHRSIYKIRFEDIKKAYLILDFEERHFDYDLEVLSNILKIDPDYINVILKHNFDDKLYVAKRDLRYNDYARLWDLSNYKKVMPYFLNYFKKFHIHDRSDEISTLFQGNINKGIDVLKSYLEDNQDDDDLIIIYNIVVSVFNDKRFDFLRIILGINDSLELFENLDFYLLSVVYSGSRLPRLRHAINEYEKVMEFLKSSDNLKYLEHINFLENRIVCKKRDIDWELKREFINDWGI